MVRAKSEQVMEILDPCDGDHKEKKTILFPSVQLYSIIAKLNNNY